MNSSIVDTCRCSELYFYIYPCDAIKDSAKSFLPFDPCCGPAKHRHPDLKVHM